jgi:tRNA/tmRNA/rRNA uracil-C5-methylase (TrmA/RlmC/RlmD family)
VAANRSAKNAWKKDGCVFGLYEKGTHQVRPIPNCVVHHPSINQAVHILEMATRRAGISAYQEDVREGDLRYVQLQVERVTGRVSLTLVWNASTLKQCQPALSRLIKELHQCSSISESSSSSLWHSLWLHCNESMGNNIFSRSPGRWHHLSGPEFLREPMPVASLESNNHAVGWLYFTPLTFRQGNLDGFDILALDVAAAIPGGSKVCELYGGVGVLGLTALAYHYNRQNPLVWLRCSDENPSNARCFQRAVESLPNEMTGKESSKRRSDPEGITLGEIGKWMDSKKTTPYQKDRVVFPSRRTSYTVTSAAKALQMGQALGAQVLIVDPPRKGLEDEVLDELCKPFNIDQPSVDDATFLSMPEEKIHWTNDVQILVYVSCGFDALARDCDRLLSSNGGWSLRSSSGYLLFPGSDHIETLAIFERK